MTKGSIGLNAGAIWNLLSDGQHWSFEAVESKIRSNSAGSMDPSSVGSLEKIRLKLITPAATLSSVRVPTFIFK